MPIVVATRQDSVQTRLSQVVNPRQQLVGTLAYQRIDTETANLFDFVDTSTVSNTTGSLTWTNRLSPFMFMRARYDLSNVATDVTPHFANLLNVSGAAGITRQRPGPGQLGAARACRSRAAWRGCPPATTRATTAGRTAARVEIFRNRGRHSFTFGGGMRDAALDVLSQQNPRGGFTFTGASTGSDVADFLLGLPQSSTIAFGNADKRLRQHARARRTSTTTGACRLR